MNSHEDNVQFSTVRIGLDFQADIPDLIHNFSFEETFSNNSFEQQVFKEAVTFKTIKEKRELLKKVNLCDGFSNEELADVKFAKKNLKKLQLVFSTRLTVDLNSLCLNIENQQENTSNKNENSSEQVVPMYTSNRKTVSIFLNYLMFLKLLINVP